ncbi:MAG: mandelate racemase/muconate lactonizing enzyme family protein [Lachnospiraceae bacterium]|jgi:L-alanine-DL-glutamate epimerase-like enolase superfamily enzyme|nr:mandelate racemase/muconate lactonizing enzyme family protein [Lachnospiraceae bacterium]
MKIIDIKTELLHIPVERALLNKTKSRAYMEVIPVKILTDEGICGYGYTYTDGFGGHAVRTLIDTDIKELLLGKNPLEVKRLSAYLLWELRQAGFSGITVLGAAAVDLSLWDIYSKAADLPICSILGQYRDQVPMYASVAGWSGLPREEMVERAGRLLMEQKMVGIKIQVGRESPEQDAKRVEALRITFGKDVKLFIDANTILDVEGAIKLARCLEEYDIFWFEEPISIRNPMGHRRIAESTAVPLATGENFFGIHETDEYIRGNLVSYMQADVIRTGGITEWLRIAANCDAQGIKVSPHFVMEVTAQVQCCVPNSLYVEYIPWFQEHFADPVRTKDGFALARETPGLGLKFKEETLKRYRIDS